MNATASKSFRVRAASLTDPKDVVVFPSPYAASKAIQEKGHKNVSHLDIRACASEAREAYGYRWSVAEPPFAPLHVLGKQVPAPAPAPPAKRKRDEEAAAAAVEVVERPGAKFVFASPRMRGKTLDMYADKDVVYIVTFEEADGKRYLKLGKSSRGENRQKAHMAHYPNAEIWCMVETDYMSDLETAFKARMKYMDKLVTAVVDGRREVEIATDIAPEDAEAVLLELQADFEARDVGRLALRRIELEKVRAVLAFREKQLDALRAVYENYPANGEVFMAILQSILALECRT